MLLKPDRLNGRQIFRGVEMSGGVNHQNDVILFPPTVLHGPTPLVPLSELIAEAMAKFDIVGDKQKPIAITGAMLQTQVHKLLAHYMKRAAINERERCRRALEKNGMREAQHAIMGNTDG